jgi:hypothetical protein
LHQTIDPLERMSRLRTNLRHGLAHRESAVIVPPPFGGGDVENIMRPMRTSFSKVASAFLFLLAAPALAEEPIVKAAGSFATFQEDVANLEKSPIKTGKQLDAALDRMAAHSPKSLSTGYISFGALNAAQSPSFNASLQKIRKSYGDDRLYSGLKSDMNYASRLPGSGDAVQAALNTALIEGAKASTVGEQLEQKAYSLQKLPMKSERAPVGAVRVAQLKAAQEKGRPVSSTFLAAMSSPAAGQSQTEQGSRLLQQISEALKIGPSSAYASSTSLTGGLKYKAQGRDTIDRMVTLAAYQELDPEAKRASEQEAVMMDPKTKDCLEWSKLQLNQCVSASRFKYEHAFCLGRHALKDVGACMKNPVQ